MKIPKTVKIGGIIYSVQEVDRLTFGDSATAEINYRKSTIEIAKDISEQRKHRDFLHEVMHAIYDNLGYSEHNEKQIDELAGALYQFVVDNSEVFK